jgi:hypothetical protein
VKTLDNSSEPVLEESFTATVQHAGREDIPAPSGFRAIQQPIKALSLP